jgi:hypothetical protein
MGIIKGDGKPDIVGLHEALPFFPDDFRAPLGPFFVRRAAVNKNAADLSFLNDRGKSAAQIKQRGKTGCAKNSVEIEQEPTNIFPGRVCGIEPYRLLTLGRPWHRRTQACR